MPPLFTRPAFLHALLQLFSLFNWRSKGNWERAHSVLRVDVIRKEGGEGNSRLISSTVKKGIVSEENFARTNLDCRVSWIFEKQS